MPRSDDQADPAAGRLEASGLGATLGGRTVLRDVGFAIEPGRMVALVGPNGAGKTTLLRRLAGLLPGHGRVVQGGADVSALAPRERARRIAYLPQGHQIHWPLPVRDVVALGRFPHGAAEPGRLRPADAAAIARAMAAADVERFAERRATELSGGERARVALARVLAVEAPVVLADEPTASLDPRHQLAIMRVLAATAAEGAIVVLVTHDLGLAARFSGRLLVLAEGRLVADGPPAAALADEVLADVFGIRGHRVRHAGEELFVPLAQA